MTLKGKKNHYNVKLLRGYGVSISLKDNKIHLKNGVDILSGKSETESWFITQLPYEKIVISGKGVMFPQMHYLFYLLIIDISYYAF